MCEELGIARSTIYAQKALEGGDPETMVRLNELVTLGYLVSDLAIGACYGPINVSPGGISHLIVYPPSSLDQAFFEAHSEQALVLPVMGRTEVGVNVPECISERPFSMTLSHEHILGFEVPGPFQPPTTPGRTLWRFSAEHLAVLGDRAVVTEVDDFYPGSHARTPLPYKVFAVAREHPHWLPSLRFWVAIAAAWKRNIRLQDFAFPALPKRAHQHLAATATVGSRNQLLDAIPVGQITPGPVFTTATFIGYLLVCFRVDAT